MSYIEELQAIATNKEPISLLEAIMISRQNSLLVMVSAIVEFSERDFRSVHNFLTKWGKGFISRVSMRSILLKNGALIRFYTDSEIERGALRGCDVIWFK